MFELTVSQNSAKEKSRIPESTIVVTDSVGDDVRGCEEAIVFAVRGFDSIFEIVGGKEGLVGIWTSMCGCA